jgi:hypothetical protein
MVTSTLSQTAGLTVDQHADGFLVFRVRDVTRKTVDAVFDAFQKYDREAFEAGLARRTLVDMRQAGWPTPYAVMRMVQSARETPRGLRESVAVVVGHDRMAFRLLERLLSRLTTHAQQSTRLFINEEEAINWLRRRE